MLTTDRAFQCPRCGMVSHHPDDIAEGYCGKCHDITRPGADATRLAVGDVTPLPAVQNPPGCPIPQATLLGVAQGVLAQLGFPDWVQSTRITQLTLTRAAVTVDWQDDSGGGHHFTIGVAP